MKVQLLQLVSHIYTNIYGRTKGYQQNNVAILVQGSHRHTISTWIELVSLMVVQVADNTYGPLLQL